MPLSAEQLAQVALILQTVQQVSAVTAAATSTKKSKKTSIKDELSDPSSLWQPAQAATNQLQSLTIDPAAGTAIEAILDSDATASIFPRNYKHLSKYTEYETPSYATMADSESKLKIYGTTMYGSFLVLVAYIQGEQTRNPREQTANAQPIIWQPQSSGGVTRHTRSHLREYYQKNRQEKSCRWPEVQLWSNTALKTRFVPNLHDDENESIPDLPYDVSHSSQVSIVRYHRVWSTNSKHRRLSLCRSLRRHMQAQAHGLRHEEKGIPYLHHDRS
jgi:hypothetical protein